MNVTYDNVLNNLLLKKNFMIVILNFNRNRRLKNIVWICEAALS